MKQIIIMLVSFVAASVYADTLSNRGYYLGGGAYNVKNNTSSDKWTPAEVFGGYKMSPYVGGEIRIGTSPGGKTKITNYESLYYRTESANSVGKTYLLAGFSQVNLEASNGKISVAGPSYGAGVGFIVNDYFNVNLEYKVLVTGSGTLTPKDKAQKSKDVDMKLESVGLSVDYRF
jgi:hypothetical protein